MGYASNHCHGCRQESTPQGDWPEASGAPCLATKPSSVPDYTTQAPSEQLMMWQLASSQQTSKESGEGRGGRSYISLWGLISEVTPSISAVIIP